VHAELGEVVSGRKPVDRVAAGRTVFASCGSGIESLAAVAGVLACLRDNEALARVELNGTGI